MRPLVTVVDYGIGNLFSVARALERVGANVVLAETATDIHRAPRLILPGVGSFAHGMGELKKRGYVDPLVAYAHSGRPLLGICLGMQLMFEVSEEFGEHQGLGLLPGKVVAVPSSGLDGLLHKIPHIGWNGLIQPNPGRWTSTILADIPEGSAAYFIHSFTAVPTEQADRLADTYYDGRLISAAVGRGLTFGCQFHPEKSGSVGLRMLENFTRLSSPAVERAIGHHVSPVADRMK